MPYKPLFATMDKCKIVGAFDTETTNINDLRIGACAFPILYQYGHVKNNVELITPDNAASEIDISIARNEQDIYKCFNAEIEAASGYVPVIAVHNLGFDMYSLAPYLIGKNVQVLAKTAKKPISFRVLDDDGNTQLVFLDTLGLFMKSLKTLGEECGMPKAVGSWDYMLIRTPDTELTGEELHYAKQDIYTLLTYIGYFLRLNPDIKQDDIGNRVQTKTGIVRAKRLVHVGNVKASKSSVRQYWHVLNQSQKPKSDDELFTMHAATRGGFTFCSRANASKVFMSDDKHVLESYDSTSQHPAQMVSHLYPQDFKEASQEQLQIAFDTCSSVSLDRVLSKWVKPFPFAFYAAFKFENLKPKEGSIFKHEGIYPLASARINANMPTYDNQANSEFAIHAKMRGYCDSVIDGVYSFGKLESAKRCILYLTELEAWILSQVYEWDSVTSISGYLTTKFRKAPDMAVLSVMRYYAAKDALKEFMGSYKADAKNDVGKIASYYPDSFVAACKDGKASNDEIKEQYMLSKADLNSLFGIEATNECRRDYELSSDIGLELVGVDGIHNLPKQVKAFYQFGQRIVAWSRVAQVCVMELIAPYIDNIICGDTDSLKIYYKADNKDEIVRALSKHAKAVDSGKRIATARVRKAYRNMYVPLDGIGHYVFDGAYDGFSASWNKSYIALSDGKCHLTIAGVPTSRRSENKLDSFNDFCNMLFDGGMSFHDIASLAIGYNVTIDDGITKLNSRLHPQTFGGYVDIDIKDYKGNVSHVHAPQALSLFPSAKTLGDTETNSENRNNLSIALANNKDVNCKPVWLKWQDGKPYIEE